jgi:hypothetical protein
VVHQHDIGVCRGSGAGDLLKFAFADQRSRIGAIAALNDLSGNLGAGRCGKLAELCQRLFQVSSGGLRVFAIASRGVARLSGARRQIHIPVSA